MKLKDLQTLSNHVSRFHWIPHVRGEKVLYLRPYPLSVLAKSKLSTDELVFELLNDLTLLYDGIPDDLLDNCRKDLEAEIERLRSLPAEKRKMRICPIDRKEFVPRHGRQVYCSSRCQQRGRRLGKEAIKRRLASDTLMRRCQAPGCERSLIGRRSDARYCSNACSKRASYWKNRGKG